MRRAILDAGYSLEAIEVVAEVSPDIDIENALDYLAVCAVEILITRCLPYYLCRGYGTLVIKHVRCSNPQQRQRDSHQSQQQQAQQWQEDHHHAEQHQSRLEKSLRKYFGFE